MTQAWGRACQAHTRGKGRSTDETLAFGKLALAPAGHRECSERGFSCAKHLAYLGDGTVCKQGDGSPASSLSQGPAESSIGEQGPGRPPEPHPSSSPGLKQSCRTVLY